MEENKSTFEKFWKKNGTNMIAALIITLVLCGLLGSQTATLTVPLWLGIGVVCWVIHGGYLFYKWKKEGGDEA